MPSGIPVWSLRDQTIHAFPDPTEPTNPNYLTKCKARLVVRGDQQRVNQAEENHAATLATRSFRALLAIAAKFDLELKQFDAVNAFVNASLDEDIFMEMPTGHRYAGKVLKLNKALYGLRRSPRL